MQPARDNVSTGRVHRSGFTLVELLVLMAIIALLISIAMPSLASMRSQSKRHKCANHLRVIAAASLAYASEDDGEYAIPIHPRQYQQDPNNPTFIGAYDWGGKSGNGPGQRTAPGCEGPRYGTQCGFGPGTRPLNFVMYKGGFPDYTDGTPEQWAADEKLRLGELACPADDGPPQGSHCQDWIDSQDVRSYDWYGTSFAANIFMIGTSGGGTPMRSNSPYLRPLSRVPAPSNVLYYEENIGRWAWATRNETSFCRSLGLPGTDPGSTKTVRGWHRKDWTYNRAFVDGHVEYQRIILEGTEDEDGYFNHYRNDDVWENCDRPNFFSWNNPPCAVDHTCVIVRGDGWQKDCLPSPTINTGLISPRPGRPVYESCPCSTMPCPN
ncbi:MAG: hypothetical protein FLDDKLPJ_02247 [Phycisphaerae bacterium]|nr:hypothetical protein [Phycisphaerae bacterium]